MCCLMIDLCGNIHSLFIQCPTAKQKKGRKPLTPVCVLRQGHEHCTLINFTSAHTHKCWVSMFYRDSRISIDMDLLNVRMHRFDLRVWVCQKPHQRCEKVLSTRSGSKQTNTLSLWQRVLTAGILKSKPFLPLAIPK